LLGKRKKPGAESSHEKKKSWAKYRTPKKKEVATKANGKADYL